MDKEYIRNRMNEIQQEYNNVVNTIQKLQIELDQLVAHRIRLDGARHELEQLLGNEQQADSDSNSNKSSDN